MDFKGKDESFVSEWLSKQGFKPAVVDAFFGNVNIFNVLATKFTTWLEYTYVENEVDGDAFLLLSEEQIKQLIATIGPQVKFVQKQKLLCASLPAKQTVTDNAYWLGCAILNSYETYTYKSSFFQWNSNSKERMRLFWWSGYQEKDSVRV